MTERYWTQRRKARVVHDVATGNISYEAAAYTNDISFEELDSWIDRTARGISLKATIQTSRLAQV